MKPIRLDKFLADAGIGTRSEVKKYIYWKKVAVNGVTASDPGLKVNPDTDEVTYKKELVGKKEEFEYYLLYKPAGCVSATEDKFCKTVMDYVPKSKNALFPVGRLDKDTEGLLLITNDGALAHDLLSPKKHVQKTYYAIVSGKVTEEDAEKMKAGVDIGEEKPTLPAVLTILSTRQQEDGTWQSEIQLTICEGKFHQVKRMLQAVGKEVTYLKRISMGNLTLPDTLEKGAFLKLTKKDILG